MGLIWEIFKALGEGETPQEREKCKKSGMSPGEWEDENEDVYED